MQNEETNKQSWPGREVKMKLKLKGENHPTSDRQNYSFVNLYSRTENIIYVCIFLYIFHVKVFLPYS